MVFALPMRSAQRKATVATIVFLGAARGRHRVAAFSTTVPLGFPLHCGMMTASSSSSETGHKLDSPSAQRNKDPIWNVLESRIVNPIWRAENRNGNTKRVLEVAAGSGIHMDYFCRQLRRTSSTSTVDGAVEWFPADMDEAYLASIQARVHELQTELTNEQDTNGSIIHDPLPATLDTAGIQQRSTRERLSSVGCFDLLLSINMIHIAPWSATLGLFRTAQELLHVDTGRLVLYGPFFFTDTPAIPSNVQFDASLRARNSDWGIRNVASVVQVARDHGMELVPHEGHDGDDNDSAAVGIVPMPANNHMLIFRKSPC